MYPRPLSALYIYTQTLSYVHLPRNVHPLYICLHPVLFTFAPSLTVLTCLQVDRCTPALTLFCVSTQIGLSIPLPPSHSMDLALKIYAPSIALHSSPRPLLSLMLFSNLTPMLIYDIFPTPHMNRLSYPALSTFAPTPSVHLCPIPLCLNPRLPPVL